MATLDPYETDSTSGTVTHAALPAIELPRSRQINRITDALWERWRERPSMSFGELICAMEPLFDRCPERKAFKDVDVEWALEHLGDVSEVEA